jgi:hypothetical protein
MTDLFSQAEQNNKSINLDGIFIYPNKVIGIYNFIISIGIKEDYLENNLNIASVLQYHMNNASLLKELNKSYGLKKKNISITKKITVAYYTQKNRFQAVNIIIYKIVLWKDMIKNFMENHLDEIQSLTEIEEVSFLNNL